MPDASDLAATLRRRADEVMAEVRERAGQGETVHDSIVGLWAVEDVQPIAAALERGAAVERCYHEAVGRFDRLTAALMESVERGESQGAQLELIADAGDAYADWEDESRALWVRAKAAAAKNAADRERGAAAERALAARRVCSASWRIGTEEDQERLLAAQFETEAAYDALISGAALTEGKPT